MNIVLIHPYITVRDPHTYLSEPLGLVCLATYLKQVFQEEITVHILDLYALGANIPVAKDDLHVLGIHDENFIKAELEIFKPDLIGITCNFTAYALDSLEVASIVKRVFPYVPVVLGGAHATIEAENLLNNNQSIDYIIRNEGEITLEYLIKTLQGKYVIEKVDGLTYKNTDNMIVSNQGRELITNLDLLPIPDRSLIDMKRYQYYTKNCYWYIRQDPAATITTSRGCPYNCVFCSTKVMWQRKWRPRSLEQVFEEIECLVSRYGIREIIIIDDQFFAEKKRIMDFCDYFIARDLGISFWYESGTSPWLLDKELLVKMRQAGFYALRLTIESGSEETLKFIRKPINLDKMKELINLGNALGYWTSANFIIGFPYETREEIYKTIRYAYSSALDYAFFFIAKPHAGSDLYEIYKNEGLLEQNVIRSSYYYASDHDTTMMKADELNVIMNKASNAWFIHKAVFFMNPINFYKHLLSKMKSFDDWKYFIKIICIYLKRKKPCF